MPLGSRGEVKMKKFPSKKDLNLVRDKLNKGIASRPLPKNANVVDRAKFRLCEKFVIYKNTHQITQREMAKKIGINEALVSKILHYHFDEFTSDRLLKYLSALYPDIDLKIEVA